MSDNIVYLGSIVATGVLCSVLFRRLCASGPASLLGAAP